MNQTNEKSRQTNYLNSVRTMVIILGGADYKYIRKHRSLGNLLQDCHESIEVDGLWRNKDVSTAILSQFLTGKKPDETGVRGRKRYSSPTVEKIEKNFLRKYSGYIPFEISSRRLREGIYEMIIGHNQLTKRNYTRHDMVCETLFDKVPDSNAVCVPAYNPEPSWAIRRNILDPTKYPDLGFSAADSLLLKNFNWRKRKLRRAVEKRVNKLTVVHFQYLDSLQHLYKEYGNDPERIKEGYEKMSSYVADVKAQSDADRTIIMSENGAYTHSSENIHRKEAYYSTDFDTWGSINMRDLHTKLVDLYDG